MFCLEVKSFFFFSISLAHNNRNTQRRGGDGSDRSPDAPVLFVRQHRKSHQQDRDHGNTRKNQRFGKRIQVRIYTWNSISINYIDIRIVRVPG